jgi:hypothetical protein
LPPDDTHTEEREDPLIETADVGSLHKIESVSISRIQLILAEKRTTLAVMRTGIGVFTLPLSVITVLIATSRYYDVLDTYHLLVPLLGLCAGLIVLGMYLVHRSVRRIWKQDALINRIKQQDPGLAEFYGDQL